MKHQIVFCSLLFLIFTVRCNESVILPENLASQTLQLKSATLSTNFYVSKTGNDSNAGTILFPFLTIQKGLNAATAAGDTVFVRAGIYAEYVTFNTSGATGNPIVLKNYGSDAVTIDATGSRYYGIYAHLINNIVVDGFTVINSTHYNVYISGCSNVTLQNINSQLPVVTSVIYNYLLNPSSTTWNTNINLINCNALNGGYGLYISGGNNGVMVTGGEFSYAYIDGVNIEGQGSDPSLYAQNIVINGAYSHHNGRQGLGTFGVNYVTFQNCHSAYNAASGIQIEANSSNTIVENNRCEFNCRGGGYANSGYETGIWVFNSSNSIVRRNITTGNQTGLRFGSVTNFQAYDNLIIGNNFHNPSASPDQNTSGVDFSASTGTFYNNTLVGNSASDSKLGSIYVYPASGSNIIIKNNIVVNDGSDTSLAGDMHFGQDGTSTVVSDYNLVYNANRAVDIRIVTTNHTWSDYKSLTGQDAHSIVADPLFVSTTNYQFQAASPAINAGVNVGLTSDFPGNPIIGLPDIGAYEYTALVTAPLTTYYNTQATATATKNNCGTGYIGSTVSYTVAAGKYNSTVSQAAANSLATADLNANTQNYTNANGTCIVKPVNVYYNVRMSATATKNSCGTGYTGSTVIFTVAAGRYSSTVSQAAANALASTYLNANKQAYANKYGTCTLTVTTLRRY